MYNTGKFIYVDGVKYYKKYIIEGIGKTEIIAMRLANILGIECAEYHEYTDKFNDECFLSKDLNYQGKFFLLSKLHVLNNNLPFIEYRLKNKYSNYLELMDSVIKIYLFDILFLNPDRDQSNIGLIKNKGNVKVVMFDNELIFTDSTGMSCKSDYSKTSDTFKVDDYPECDEKWLHNLEEISYFFENYPEYYRNLFRDMYDSVPPEVVGSIIEEVDPKMYDKYMDIYTRYYEVLGKVIYKERGR